jgi:hypothetical protein
MTNKPIVIMPLAAALAALGGMGAAAAATGPQAEQNAQQVPASGAGIKSEPNVFFKAGADLLGLIVTRQADGTVLAQHYSHSSHGSHASHSSHVSSSF